MYKFFIIIIALIILTVIFMYPQSKPMQAPDIIIEKIEPINEDVRIEGIIGFTNIEGGCWFLKDTITNKKYEILNVPTKELTLLNNKYVTIQGEILSRISTICQVGQPFKVKTYTLIK